MDAAPASSSRRVPSLGKQAREGARRCESLTIDNRLAELTRVERWLALLMVHWDIPDRTSFAVDLVINEALTNVISYAFPDAGIHRVTLTLTDTADHVVVEVVDDGDPFDPFTAPPPETGQELASAPIGGRGIRLIRSYAAAHDYQRVVSLNHLALAIPKDT